MFIKFCEKKKIPFHCERERAATALWDESTVDHKPGIIYPALFALQIIIATFQEYKFLSTKPWKQWNTHSWKNLPFGNQNFGVQISEFLGTNLQVPFLAKFRRRTLFSHQPCFLNFPSNLLIFLSEMDEDLFLVSQHSYFSEFSGKFPNLSDWYGQRLLGNFPAFR